MSKPPHIRTRVKVCGVTSAEDAAAAVALGVDALGLNCVPSSPRFVPPDGLARIASAVPAWVSLALVFQNPTQRQVEQALALLPHALCQFHGEEPPGFCRGFGRPYVKTVPPELMGDAAHMQEWHPGATLLLDQAGGGSGQPLDWAAIAPPQRPWALAGGLGPENAAQAMAVLSPWGLDLSSGVESSPGVKDAALMAELMRVVAREDGRRQEAGDGG